MNENACINGSHSHACALVGYQIETIAIVTNFLLSRCLGHRGFYSTNEISRSVDERRFESWRPAIPVTLSCNFPSAGPLCGLRGLNITPKFPPFVSRPSTTSHLIRLSLPAGLKKVLRLPCPVITVWARKGIRKKESSLKALDSPLIAKEMQRKSGRNATSREGEDPFPAVFLEEREK
ncbi:hypothetical protein V6N11_053170 [Hibiscus sabdariffa]|uniref:Uncharacterized protein n=2 Tax=Hibiscus sabdariffa TaxID=183260 RepID=A0ABR2AXM0_9ROSI